MWARTSSSAAPSRRFSPRADTSVAPVTVDNDDFVYAAAYASALRRGDAAAAARIGDDYLRYMDEVFIVFRSGLAEGARPRDSAGAAPARQHTERGSIRRIGGRARAPRLSLHLRSTKRSRTRRIACPIRSSERPAIPGSTIGKSQPAVDPDFQLRGRPNGLDGRCAIL